MNYTSPWIPRIFLNYERPTLYWVPNQELLASCQSRLREAADQRVRDHSGETTDETETTWAGLPCSSVYVVKWFRNLNGTQDHCTRIRQLLKIMVIVGMYHPQNNLKWSNINDLKQMLALSCNLYSSVLKCFKQQKLKKLKLLTLADLRPAQSRSPKASVERHWRSGAPRRYMDCGWEKGWMYSLSYIIKLYHVIVTGRYSFCFFFFLFWVFFSFFGPLVPWSSNPLVPWSSRPPSSRPLIVWSPVPWSSGPHGPLVLWSPAPLVFWFPGPLFFFVPFFLTSLLLCFTISFIYSLCLVFVSLVVLCYFLCCRSFHAFQCVDFFYFHSLYVFFVFSFGSVLLVFLFFISYVFLFFVSFIVIIVYFFSFVLVHVLLLFQCSIFPFLNITC